MDTYINNCNTGLRMTMHIKSGSIHIYEFVLIGFVTMNFNLYSTESERDQKSSPEILIPKLNSKDLKIL